MGKNRSAKLISPFKSIDEINYREVHKLSKFITTRGRIIESEKTGLSLKEQKKLGKAIKRARYMALLPFNQYV